MNKSWDEGIPYEMLQFGTFFLFEFFGFAFLCKNSPNILNLYFQFISKNIITFSHMQLPEDPGSDVWQRLYHH